MAITYTQVSSAITNPSTGFIPVNNADNFKDSYLVYDGTELYFTNGNNDIVFSFIPGTNILYFGLPTISQSYIYIDTGGYILLAAPGVFRINAPTDPTPPGGSPVYLPVNVNGTNYKIKLQA